MHTSPMAAAPLPLEPMAGQQASPDPGLIHQPQAQPSEPGQGCPYPWATTLGRKPCGGGYLSPPLLVETNLAINLTLALAFVILPVAPFLTPWCP
jgi:hypothetical protein